MKNKNLLNEKRLTKLIKKYILIENQGIYKKYFKNIKIPAPFQFSFPLLLLFFRQRTSSDRRKRTRKFERTELAESIFIFLNFLFYKKFKIFKFKMCIYFFLNWYIWVEFIWVGLIFQFMRYRFYLAISFEISASNRLSRIYKDQNLQFYEIQYRSLQNPVTEKSRSLQKN